MNAKKTFLSRLKKFEAALSSKISHKTRTEGKEDKKIQHQIPRSAAISFPRRYFGQN